MEKAIITNIQRFSIHDGPGIRTVVFFKGCPLRCLWCANPETHLKKPEISWQPTKCIGCGYCYEHCPENALKREDWLRVDKEKCTLCGQCISECFAGAIKLEGEEKTTQEILAEVLKDKAFFEESGGGITISGGEVLMQPEAASELLKMAKEAGITTAIETTGYAKREALDMVAAYCDTILYDVKHISSETHKKFTGVPNEIILDNIKYLAAQEKNVIVRIPLIPTFNLSDELAGDLADFMNEAGLKTLNVLPFHQLARGKYSSLNKEYSFADVEPPTNEEVQHFADIVRNKGIEVSIGG